MHSHCRATLTTIHLPNFSLFKLKLCPHWVPTLYAPSPLSTPWPLASAAYLLTVWIWLFQVPRISGIKSWKDLPVASLAEATERHNCTCVNTHVNTRLCSYHGPGSTRSPICFLWGSPRVSRIWHPSGWEWWVNTPAPLVLLGETSRCTL